MDILRLEFFQNALLAGLLIGAFCSYLGVLVVLKRVVFVGAALAEVSSAGIAVAFLLGFASQGGVVLLFSLGLTLLAVAFFARPGHSRRLPDESLIALVFVAAAALAIVFVSKSAEGLEEIHHLVSGNILTVSRQEVLVVGVTFSLLMAFLARYHHRLAFVSFDPEMAASLGIRAGRWNLAFFLVVGVALSLSIRAMGTLLAFGYLVLPAMTGLLACRRLAPAMAVSVAAGGTATVLGLFLSVAYDLPSSPTIVVMAVLLLGATALAARLRHGGG